MEPITCLFCFLYITTNIINAGCHPEDLSNQETSRVHDTEPNPMTPPRRFLFTKSRVSSSRHQKPDTFISYNRASNGKNDNKYNTFHKLKLSQTK